MGNTKPLQGGFATLFVIGLVGVFSLCANAAPQEESGAEFRATGYVLTQAVQLHPVQVNNGGAADAGALELPAGTELAVLETAEGGRFVRVGLDSDEASKLPQDFWVRSDELPASALAPFAPADENESPEGLFDFLGKIGKGGMTYCYRYVKQYLLQQHLVPVYLPGGSAWQAASLLPKYGFHRLSGGPGATRHNDVCVYSGGRGGNGHIEVNRGGKWWYGYGFINHPITPVNHRLLGCFRKG